MTTKNETPDLPAFDPKADRGNTVVEPVAPPQMVELTAEELTLIGKATPTVEKDPEADKKAADRGDTLTQPEPAKEEAKTEAAKTDEEPAKEEAKTDDKPRDKEGKFIPKARFDEVNNRAKVKVAELEAKIKKLEGAQAPSAPADVKVLEDSLDTKSAEYSQLLADGDLPAANLVMREINKINRQLGVIEATALSTAHSQEVQHVQTLEDLVGIYKENYPQFDDANKDHYSQDIVDYVAKLQGGFELSGLSPADSLREAVEAAVAKFQLDQPAPAAAKEEEAPAEPAKPDKAAERKTAAVDKALEASKAQPAALSKVGTDSDKVGMSKIDVSVLSYDQFQALPESTLARLRGDNV